MVTDLSNVVPRTQCTADQWPDGRSPLSLVVFRTLTRGKRQADEASGKAALKSCETCARTTVTVGAGYSSRLRRNRRDPPLCVNCPPQLGNGVRRARRRRRRRRRFLSLLAEVSEVSVVVTVPRSLDVSNGCRSNSHDRETCARSLRATQESRPSPGAFPPPAPSIGTQLQQQNHQPNHQPQAQQQQVQQPRCCVMNQSQRTTNNARAHRPASLDIGVARRCPIGCIRPTPSPPTLLSAPSSAPAACTARGFFDESVNDIGTTNGGIVNGTAGNAAFELNVNVACSPAGNRDFRTVPTIGACKRSDLIVEPRPHYAEPLAVGKNGTQIDHTRSYTSVSLTLRPPSSEPQPPIDIRSQGSSLTYSTSSLDPRGFQSRLQISIGPGSVGSVAAARIRPPMAPTRPNSLIPPVQTGPHRPPGLPAGPPSQLPRPTTTMSAPTTPSVPPVTGVVSSSSLPTTPSGPTTTSPPSSPAGEPAEASSDQNRSPLNQVAEHQRKLVAEQLARKERLAKELRAEKGRLEAMKKELQSLARPFDSSIPPHELKRILRSEIYQLQIECDRLADEVDQRSDPRVPLGETNEEFYQGIYTGQPFLPRSYNQQPPPLPSHPPAWQPSRQDAEREERDGPSWVCRMCTFDNHPLLNKCEQCDMPRLLDHGNAGETQDIHIRVTHHHNFSPRRTVHSWVV